VKSDYSDLRFTDLSNNQMSYWIEDANLQQATIWVKVPSIPSSGTQIYIYYGNSAAPAVSSGPSTFILFDDFSSVGSSWSQSGSLVPSSSGLALSNSGKLVSTQLFGPNTAVGIKGTLTTSQYNVAGFQGSDVRGTMFYSAYPASGAVSALNRNPYPTQSSSALSGISGLHTYEVSRKGTSSVAYSVDGNPLATLTQNVPATQLPVFIWAQSGSMTVNWVYIRASAANEPSSVGTGSEQFNN
jgi:hypothetical protein